MENEQKSYNIGEWTIEEGDIDDNELLQQLRIEDETFNAEDELIMNAQDAFFSGDLETTIKLCTEALKTIKDDDAFEMLSLALFQSRQYSRAIQIASEWLEHKENNLKQWQIILRSSYLSDNIEKMKEAANKLEEILRYEEDQENATIHLASICSLLSDLNLDLAEQVAKMCQNNPQIDINNESVSDIFKLQTLLELSKFFRNPSCTTEEVLAVLKQLKAKYSVNLSLGLAYALTAIILMEKATDVRGADELIQDFITNHADLVEENILGAKALLELKKPDAKTPLANLKNIATGIYKGANDIIRKRLESQLLSE